MLTRSRRVIVGFALASLLGLTAACGASDDGGTDGDGASVAAGPAAGDPAPGQAPPPGAGGGVARGGAGTADTSVSGTGMDGGCEATRKIFLALEAGDTAAADTLKGKADALFEDVAASEATKNIDLAYDGAAMASEMDYEWPEKKFLYQSDLAKQYGTICVTKHNAEALPG